MAATLSSNMTHLGCSHTKVQHRQLTASVGVGGVSARQGAGATPPACFLIPEQGLPLLRAGSPPRFRPDPPVEEVEDR